MKITYLFVDFLCILYIDGRKIIRYRKNCFVSYNIKRGYVRDKLEFIGQASACRQIINLCEHMRQIGVYRDVSTNKSLPPRGRWILRSKRRKEPAKVQNLRKYFLLRTLLQSPAAPAPSRREPSICANISPINQSLK